MRVCVERRWVVSFRTRTRTVPTTQRETEPDEGEATHKILASPTIPPNFPKLSAKVLSLDPTPTPTPTPPANPFSPPKPAPPLATTNLLRTQTAMSDVYWYNMKNLSVPDHVESNLVRWSSVFDGGRRRKSVSGVMGDGLDSFELDIFGKVRNVFGSENGCRCDGVWDFRLSVGRWSDRYV